MAINLSFNRAKQKVYVSGYSALLLIAISVLALQGGFFALVGLSCWVFTVLGCSYCYLKRIKVNCLKNYSVHGKQSTMEEEGKDHSP